MKRRVWIIPRTLQLNASAKYIRPYYLEKQQVVNVANLLSEYNTLVAPLCFEVRSDSIFPQQRLLVRDDVELFLAEAFNRDGVVRAVLHGLPGIGCS